jgi:hypothetical protein
MFRGGILMRIVFALLIIGVLSAGTVGLYRMGYAQGYQTAAITAQADDQGSGTEGGRVAPWAYGPMGYGYGPHWGPGFGFFPFFPFIGLGFFLLFLFLIGGLFRGMAYRRWGGGPGWGPGPGPGYWHHHDPAHEPGEKKEEGTPQSPQQ